MGGVRGLACLGRPRRPAGSVTPLQPSRVKTVRSELLAVLDHPDPAAYEQFRVGYSQPGHRRLRAVIDTPVAHNLGAAHCHG